MDEKDLTELKSAFEAAGQGHVFEYLPSLSEAEQSSLLEQLKGIEVDKLSKLLESALSEQKSDGSDITSFSKNVAQVNDNADGQITKSRQIGLDAIKSGEVAALVLAGGQGTRLGFNGPKGMYDIGMPSKRSLFQMISERLTKLSQLASSTSASEEVDEGSEPDAKKQKTDAGATHATAKTIPLYIMTSPINHTETEEYFKSNSYFGLPSDSVYFFQQGMLPCLTNDGKIIMETKSKVSMAPDGNGGIYPSMVKAGALEDMKKKGIKYLHVFSIDNALVKPADPVFMGYCIKEGADCGNKVLWKSHAHEKVGVIAEKGGKPCIVEYSDITTEMAEKTDDNGRLVFGAGNICNHFYTLDFIDKVVLPNMGDMYHVARKKIPFYDQEKKVTIKPTSNNGIKLETFIFDVFPLSESMAVLDVNREEEFAPVKNAPGSASDSPDTARVLLSSLSKKWVSDAGGNLVGEKDSNSCEVSPLTSYAGEGLEKVVAGKDIECPFSL